jgi:hypothetical protein
VPYNKKEWFEELDAYSIKMQIWYSSCFFNVKAFILNRSILIYSLNFFPILYPDTDYEMLFDWPSCFYQIVCACEQFLSTCIKYNALIIQSIKVAFQIHPLVSKEGGVESLIVWSKTYLHNIVHFWLNYLAFWYELLNNISNF